MYGKKKMGLSLIYNDQSHSVVLRKLGSNHFRQDLQLLEGVMGIGSNVDE